MQPAFVCRRATATLLSGVLLLLLVVVVEAHEVPRPRGVSISRAALYEPTASAPDSFVCLDGLKTIQYDQINDDYCDCADGSDEPGTAACPNGFFHCSNAGHRPLRLPSSRVNDGVCDCCDASDEFAGPLAGRCPNDCAERGQEDRARDKQLAELARLGSQLRADLAERGRLRKSEQAERLSELRRSHAEAEALLAERAAILRDAEQLETDALEVYRAAQDEERREREARDASAREREANEVFARFDSNADGRLDLAEMRVRAAFDRDRDGAVSDDEARYFLGEADAVDRATFAAEAWTRVKPYLELDMGAYASPHDDDDASARHAEEPVEAADYDDERPDEADEHPHDGLDEGHEEEEEEEEQEDEDETGEGAVEPVAAEPTPPPVEYDPETKAIVEQANGARQLHGEAEREARSLASEISGIEEQLQKDYGPDEEFAALHGECFSFEDREYEYKVCPFDRAVQKSRGGGAETRLGAWERWAGPANNPYAVMKFANGAACWNGPQRSATVHLECGLETRLLAVSEPNRCEYVCTMQTPAVCSVDNLPSASKDGHDEL